MIQVAVVQLVHVAIVNNSDVSTTGTMLVIATGALLLRRHNDSSLVREYRRLMPAITIRHYLMFVHSVKHQRLLVEALDELSVPRQLLRSRKAWEKSQMANQIEKLRRFA
jgi:hypothetical protein